MNRTLNPPNEPATQMAGKWRVNPPEADEYGKSGNNQSNEWVCKPSSVSRPIRTGGGHLSRPTVTSRLKRPTCWQSPPVSGLTLGPSNQLLGLAGGGVCPAGDVTIAAVRSYRTISPLPREITSRRSLLPTPAHYLTGLCIFCGTFPRVAPGGR